MPEPPAPNRKAGIPDAPSTPNFLRTPDNFIRTPDMTFRNPDRIFRKPDN